MSLYIKDTEYIIESRIKYDNLIYLKTLKIGNPSIKLIEMIEKIPNIKNIHIYFYKIYNLNEKDYNDHNNYNHSEYIDRLIKSNFCDKIKSVVINLYEDIDDKNKILNLSKFIQKCSNLKIFKCTHGCLLTTEEYLYQFYDSIYNSKNIEHLCLRGIYNLPNYIYENKNNLISLDVSTINIDILNICKKLKYISIHDNTYNDNDNNFWNKYKNIEVLILNRKIVNNINILLRV